MYRQSEVLASFLPRWQLELLAERTSLPDAPGESATTGAVLFIDVSGFTQLTRSLAQQGKRGAETLSRLIDSVFGPVTDIVSSHGGDILFFAGDSAIAVWRVREDGGLENATHSAVSAACVIQGRSFGSADARIHLRASIGAGAIRALELGGVDDKWLFMVDGDALEQVVACDAVAEPGTVTMSTRAVELAGDRVETRSIGPTAACLERLQREPPHNAEFRSLPILDEEIWPHLVPGVVFQHVSQDMAEWLAEFRTASVVVMSLDRGKDDTGTLDALVRLMQESIFRLEGQVYQCLVDDKGANLLATFGMPPLAHEDDAERSLLAAIDVRNRLAEAGAAASIGVASGAIWGGLYGTRERRQYSIVGPAINLASRLMKLAKGRILCDATTARSAGRIMLGDAGKVEVKGYDQAVAVYEATDVRRDPLALTRHSGFVGREAELQAISTLLDQLEARSARAFVLLEGDTGLGKSSLIARVLGSLPESFACLAGSAEAIDAARPYAVWKSIFQQLFGIDAQATPSAADQQRVLEQLGDQRQLSPLLNVAIGSRFEDNELTAGLTSELRAVRTRALLTELVVARAGSGPLVILLEGGHWFDSHSWSLLRTIADTDAPVVLLVTTRPLESLPDELRDLVERTDSARMTLGPLSRDETLSLIKTHLGVTDLPMELGELVVDRAGGHPLFVEQLLLALREAGVFTVDDGVCFLQGDTQERERVAKEVAVSLGGIVKGRTDRLSASQQLAIKTASVIGMRFGTSMLAAVHPGERRESLLTDLEELVSRRFLRQAADAAGTYSFENALIRDVIYESLPFQQRQETHRAIAQWHQDAGLADSPSMWPVLAHHYRHAESPGEASTYFDKAGTNALQEHASAEAAQYLGEALELCDSKSGSNDGALLVKHGLANVNWSRHDAGRSSLERGLALLDRQLPPSAAAAAMRSAGQLGAQLLRRLRSAAVSAQDGIERDAKLHVSRGYEGLVEAYFIAGEQLSCLYCALRALNVAEAAGASAELARGYASISALFGMMRLERFATAYEQRALETAAEVGDPEARAWTLLSVGIYKLGNAAWLVAEQNLRAAADSYRDLQHPRREYDCRISLCNMHLIRGNVEEAERELQLCEQLALLTRDLRAEGAVLRNRIVCYALRHDRDALVDAETKLKRFLAPGPSLRKQESDALFALRAWIATRLGRQADAEEYADVTLASFKEYSAAYYPLVNEFHALAEVLLRGGASAQSKLVALEELVRGHARTFPIGQPGHLWLGGKLAQQRGNTARARRLFQKSARKSEQLRMPYNAVLAYAELADIAASGEERREREEAARQHAEPLGIDVDHVRIAR